MGDRLKDFGYQAAGGILGAGLGLITGQYNREKQLEQQQKLQDMQIKGSKEMADYNMMKQLEMWKATNYSAQVEELKKAGLNPGMLYGMSGSGGTTTGSTGTGVSGGQATQEQGLTQNISMGLQLGLMKAQMENMNANTEKTKAEATKIAGVDTTEAQSRIENIKQGIKNAEVTEKILHLEETYKEIENSVARQTIVDRMKTIEYTSKIAQETAEAIQRDNDINEETKKDKINKIKAEAIQVVANIELTQANTALKKAEIAKIANEISVMVSELDLKWYSMTLDERRTAIMERVGKFNSAQSQRTYDNILKGIQTITGSIKPVSLQ